jgi:hypothetical protein
MLPPNKPPKKMKSTIQKFYEFERTVVQRNSFLVKMNFSLAVDSSFVGFRTFASSIEEK